MIINQNKQVLKPCVLSAHEGAIDVGANETVGERWLVQRCSMCMPGCVGLGAWGTAIESAVG
eukprot:3050814-Pleurochrysis_carterae.AAC.1